MTTKGTILIVDDEESIRLICSMALQQSGFKIEQAENGFEALKIIQEKTIDLVISDVFMPKMNGFQLLQSVKSDEYYKNIPFIFLTAATDNDHITEGLQLGAEDYISKPIRIKEVLARVLLVMSRAQSRQSESTPKPHGHLIEKQLQATPVRPVGHLKDKALIDIIAFCEANSLTGELILKNGVHQGVFKYRKGELLQASLDNKDDDEAMDIMLGWDDGTFEIAQQFITFDASTKSLRSDSTREIAKLKSEDKPTEAEKPRSITSDKKGTEFPAEPIIKVLECVSMMASKIIGEAKAGNYFRRCQLGLVNTWPNLGFFLVSQKGNISMIKPMQLTTEDVEGCSRWVKDFVTVCSEKHPEFKMTHIREAVEKQLSPEDRRLFAGTEFFGFNS